MNYNLVVDTSNFKPFDISPYLQVLRDLKSARDRVSDKLEKIEEQNGQYVLPEGEYRDAQNKFNEDLEVAAEAFGRNDNDSIRNMNKMFRRYRREILPMHYAAERYNKLQDKLTALGPDAIIGNTPTFDDVYKGNTALDYRSAKQVELDSAKYFTGLNNSLMQDPQFKEILQGQYYLQTQKGGLDNGAALQAALVDYNNRTGGQYSAEVQNLLGHMQNVMNSQGVENFSDESKQRVWNKIAAGLVDAITAPKQDRVANPDYETQAEKRNWAYKQFTAEKEGYTYDPTTGRFVKTQDNANKSDGNSSNQTAEQKKEAEKRAKVEEKRKAEEAKLKQRLAKAKQEAQNRVRDAIGFSYVDDGGNVWGYAIKLKKGADPSRNDSYIVYDSKGPIPNETSRNEILKKAREQGVIKSSSSEESPKKNEASSGGGEKGTQQGDTSIFSGKTSLFSPTSNRQDSTSTNRGLNFSTAAIKK